MSKKQDLSVLRHSAAHLAAQALLELYPKTQLTIGPATKDGFFYDFLPETTLKEADLPRLEEKMRELVGRNLPLTHEQISKEKARLIFANNKFKLELIDEIPGDTVGLSRQGDFYDLCRGGHVDSTGEIQYFKLTGLSGAYWRADKQRDALQRVSGTAFLTQEAMEEDERLREEAAQNDHRRLGKLLDLFSFHPDAVGFPFFHPKGKIVTNAMVDYSRKKQNEYGYKEIQTPMMLSDELWRRSGHYKHYKENMYFCLIDDKSYALKPMNCPGSFLVYNERPRSYKELPLRLSEYGHVHRHELSGALHGLMRVRAFTQDDAHIFCTHDQLEQEIIRTMQLIKEMFARYGFAKLEIGLSTKPQKAMGSDEIWEKAEKALVLALQKTNLPYVIQEGEGAFYGPKIDVNILDSMGRKWQCSTIQVDFFQPENFNLEYVAPSGQKERCVVIHRAIYGSLERFFAILLEHYKGHLPFWLAPVQLAILTITDEQKDYATKILHDLQKMNVRAYIDETSDPISGKIKRAQLDKIPWMLIVGNNEQKDDTVTLRFSNGTQKSGISLEELHTLIAREYE